MINTPRTDASILTHLKHNGEPTVVASFARELERELAEVTSLLALCRSLEKSRRYDSRIVDWIEANAVSIGVSDTSFHEMTGPFTREQLLKEASNTP